MRLGSFRTLLPRLFGLGVVLGMMTTAVGLRARDWACPDCYRCDGGCQIGSNSYGFTECYFTGGGCEPNGGNPCCIPPN